METLFLFVKLSLITLAIIVIILNIIYIVVNINTDISEEQIPHIIGMVVGLVIRIGGLVAAIRHSIILLIVYAVAMAMITAYTALNYQFVINLLTTFTAVLFVISIRVKSCRNSVENRTEEEVTSDVISVNNTHEPHLGNTPPTHRSPSPSAPPPYRGPAPPPPYTEYFKY